MRKGLSKAIALGLCATTFATATVYATPAFAATEKTAEATQDKAPLKNRIDSILKGTDATTQTISKIPKGNAYIPKDTTLEVELVEELSSKKAHVGDAVPLRLVENLIVNDVIVAPAGSEVTGVVTKARKAGGLGRGGKLEFKITSLRTINNIDIPLEYTEGKHGAGDAGGAVVFAAVSIVGGLFMKGKNVIYNKGLKFDAKVTADTDLKTPLKDLATTMSAARPHGVSINIQ